MQNVHTHTHTPLRVSRSSSSSVSAGAIRVSVMHCGSAAPCRLQESRSVPERVCERPSGRADEKPDTLLAPDGEQQLIRAPHTCPEMSQQQGTNITLMNYVM